MKHKWSLLLVIFILFLNPLQVTNAAPSTTRFVTTGGTDSGDCSGSPCATITYAIGKAVSEDTIDIAAGDYTELGITVDKNLNIVGAGTVTTTVQAHASPGMASDRVFLINTGVAAIIQGMTIRHGNTTAGNPGGAIHNSGTLTVTETIVRENNASDNGGAIYNSSGTLHLQNSTVISNTSTSTGGGIYNAQGTLSLNGSTVISNTSTSAGGGIYNDRGNLSLSTSSVSGNSASQGGGIYVYRKTYNEINGSTIANNTATGNGGGIVFSTNSSHRLDALMTDSSVRGNISGGSGGGLVNEGSGYLTISRSTLSDNHAGTDGGGIYSSYARNTLINSTLSGNTANGHGGGIDAEGYTQYYMNLNHVTVTGNTADFDKSGGGDGGGILKGGPNSNIKNSIVAGNDDRSNPWTDDCATAGSAFQSLGYNLVGSGTGCPSDGMGDLTTTNPQLAALSDNGGTMETHALLTGSPALDQIPSATSGCGTDYSEDQRGQTRPDGGSCDMGAYEGSVGRGKRYVKVSGVDSGNDCTDSGNKCETIAHAIDVAEGGISSISRAAPIRKRGCWWRRA